MKSNKFNTLAVIASLFILLSNYSMAEPASVIDARVKEAIKQFNKETVGGERFLSQVKGYLVFPSVIKAGLVVGAEYGEGALIIDGKTKHYYNIASGSIGFQAGIQKASYIIAFASEDILNNFIKSDGWEAGVDGSITIIDWGAGKDIGSINFEKPIYAFVFDAKGLMYNLTLEGTKFTRILPK